MEEFDNETDYSDSGRNPRESAQSVRETEGRDAQVKSDDDDWEISDRKPGLATEAKAGLAVIVILVGAFAFLVYQKTDMRAQVEKGKQLASTAKQKIGDGIERLRGKDDAASISEIPRNFEGGSNPDPDPLDQTDPAAPEQTEHALAGLEEPDPNFDSTQQFEPTNDAFPDDPVAASPHEDPFPADDLAGTNQPQPTDSAFDDAGFEPQPVASTQASAFPEEDSGFPAEDSAFSPAEPNTPGAFAPDVAEFSPDASPVNPPAAVNREAAGFADEFPNTANETNAAMSDPDNVPDFDSPFGSDSQLPNTTASSNAPVDPIDALPDADPFEQQSATPVATAEPIPSEDVFSPDAVPAIANAAESAFDGGDDLFEPTAVQNPPAAEPNDGTFFEREQPQPIANTAEPKNGKPDTAQLDQLIDSAVTEKQQPVPATTTAAIIDDTTTSTFFEPEEPTNAATGFHPTQPREKVPVVDSAPQFVNNGQNTDDAPAFHATPATADPAFDNDPAFGDDTIVDSTASKRDAAINAAVKTTHQPVPLPRDPSPAPVEFEPIPDEFSTETNAVTSVIPLDDKSPDSLKRYPPRPAERRTTAEQNSQPRFTSRQANYSRNQPSAPVYRSAASPVHDNAYVVRAGDNYWSISKRVYGTNRYYMALAKLNRTRVPDPKRLRSGVTIHTPSAAELQTRYPELFTAGSSTRSSSTMTTQTAAATARKSTAKIRTVSHSAGFFVTREGIAKYRVGRTDTLGEIAQRHLGRSSEWKRIYDLNRQTLANPNRLKPGSVLVLPNDASDVRMSY